MVWFGGGRGGEGGGVGGMGRMRRMGWARAGAAPFLAVVPA